MIRRVRALTRYLVADAIGLVLDYSYALRRHFSNTASKRRSRR